MADVALRDVVKRFDEVEAVRNISLNIPDNEFVVLVGPSGCGKSTTLRMIAGLEEVTEGEILIGGDVVNDVPPKDRDIAMVFQNYALYPHMTVFENMSFGLRLRRTPKAEIRARVERRTLSSTENPLRRRFHRLARHALLARASAAERRGTHAAAFPGIGISRTAGACRSLSTVGRQGFDLRPAARAHHGAARRRTRPALRVQHDRGCSRAHGHGDDGVLHGARKRGMRARRADRRRRARTVNAVLRQPQPHAPDRSRNRVGSLRCGRKRRVNVVPSRWAANTAIRRKENESGLWLSR